MSFLIEVGLISEVSADLTKARVQIASGLATDFLPLFQPSANGVKRHFIPPQVLEQVVVFAVRDELNSGIILRGWNYDTFPIPNAASKDKEIAIYADGTVISYDTASKLFEADFAGGARVNIAGNANITVGGDLDITAKNANVTADKATIEAETTHTGNITVEGVITAVGVIGTTVTVGGPGGSELKTEGGKFKIDRELEVAGSVKSSNLVYDKWGAIRTTTSGGGN
ncbi:MAG: phage baseplate assembly protein V [Campylobacteraceae bacterium]|jgi:phage baseplate assembly protein V|nr:phage baseplate assembly protein V [Campylobacteraceae bacterium]